MIFLILTITLSAFFVPASILLRPEYFLMAAIALWGLVANKVSVLRFTSVETTLFFLLSVFALLSILGQVLSGYSVSARDFQVLVRYLVYLFAIYAGVMLGMRVRRFDVLIWLVLSLMIVAVILSFIQYFNLGGMNSLLVPFYSLDGTGHKYVILESDASWRRIIGIMGNPNYWGLVLGAGFLICFYKCSQRSYFYFIPALLLLAGIIMTGSRTALVATVLAALFGLLLIVRRQCKFDRKVSHTVVACVLLFLFYFVYAWFIENYYENQNRFSASNLHTLELRMQLWSKTLNQIFAQPQNIIIGKGPTKLESVRHGDNMYIRYLRDFGFIGLLIYLSLVYQIVKKIRLIRHDDRVQLEAYASVLLMFLCLFLVFDLAADGWFNVRIAQMWLFSYGLLLGRWYRGRRQYASFHHYS